MRADVRACRSPGVMLLLVIGCAAALPAPAPAASLADEVGRSEVRIFSAPYHLPVGRTVAEAALPERLARRGYERVRGRRPERPGEYFWGHEVFWIYRQAHRLDGDQVAAGLVGVRLARPDGRILGPASPGAAGEAPAMPYLEPLLLAESLTGDRAPRLPIAFDRLPEQVWRAVLAIEDNRFFDHAGIDPRGVARALLANVRAGDVRQGGSTLTQQLIKMRDLTPKRSLGRKASEALRALALEAEYSKEEILTSYLDTVYYGHVEGVAIHGLGRAARVFFATPAEQLDLGQAATLAAIIQGPNRLSPVRHPEAARQRRDLVLARMVELGWADEAAAKRAERGGLGVRLRPPARRAARHFIAWVAEEVEQRAPRWHAKQRGVVVETGLDPHLQAMAEEAVRDHLDSLRRHHRALRSAPLSAALIALDITSGAVLAHVGGEPDGSFDRVRSARRQPGSAVKPLLLLEAFETCGERGPLHPASRVADEPLTIDLPSGAWRPVNADGRFDGVISLRTALERSRNVPFVRLGRWCGWEATAGRLRQAGLDLPRQAPPAHVLGAVETTPLQLARAYTVFATPGRLVTVRPVSRIERPGGRALVRLGPRSRRVSRPASAYLVYDLLRQAAASGTASAGRIEGVVTAAKTGTSSERRDAWYVGIAGSIVTAVWVGRDDNEPLRLGGSQAAAPLWRGFMSAAVPARPPYRVERPSAVVERTIDPTTGLLVRGINPRAETELFRRGALPPRDRFYRRDAPVPVIR